MSLCYWCDEPVTALDEQHPSYRQSMHFACGFRAVAGSVAHILKRCGCYVLGSVENDDPNLTKRQAAEAALTAWREIEGNQNEAAPNSSEPRDRSGGQSI